MSIADDITKKKKENNGLRALPPREKEDNGLRALLPREKED